MWDLCDARSSNLRGSGRGMFGMCDIQDMGYSGNHRF